MQFGCISGAFSPDIIFSTSKCLPSNSLQISHAQALSSSDVLPFPLILKQLLQLPYKLSRIDTLYKSLLQELGYLCFHHVLIHPDTVGEFCIRKRSIHNRMYSLCVILNDLAKDSSLTVKLFHHPFCQNLFVISLP